MLEELEAESRLTSPAISTGYAVAASIPRWFLVQTKACQEQRAARFLREWTTETLLPVLPTAGEGARAPKSRLARLGPAPLFPGYIFSRFSPGDIGTANSTYGVLQVVRFGLAPAVVEDELITEIRARLDEHGVLKPVPVEDVGPRFRRGDRVGVVSGPLKGITGLFDCRLSGRQRGYILLETVKDSAGWRCSRKPPQSAGGSARLQVDLGDLGKLG